MIRVAAACLLLAACSPAATATTTTAPAVTTTAAATTTTAPLLPPQLAGWETREITIAPAGEGAEPMLVAVADEPALREQGLMNVSDLAGVAGMLFVFEEDVASGFWMKNTLLPLDIAFFAGDGSFVDRLTMEPCPGDPCPVYRPSGPYRLAVEVPAGGFDSLTGAEVLVIAE